MRNYTGLFAEQVYIEEALLAKVTGLTPTEVYMALKQLSAMRIIDFVPHRSSPTITFVRPRVETQYINLSPEVYADRRTDYERRGLDVKNYLQSRDRCRSLMLLEYFGETDARPCGHCDVCLQQRRDKKSQMSVEKRAEIAIYDLLSDGEPHMLSELDALPYSPSVTRDVLHNLLGEDVVFENNKTIRKKK